jgi:Ala-tRNA(Pro) deacylase
MPAAKLKAFLDGHHVKYVSIRHSPAYTAQEIAASAHVRGKELAKTVIVLINDRLAMAVLPASRKLDVDRLSGICAGAAVRIATEDDFRAAFPECEVGAMPPFGNLYGMDVYVDRPLADDLEIAFNGGSHSELIRLAYDDFARLARPTVAPISVPRPSRVAE